jgi:hypothetical protein
LAAGAFALSQTAISLSIASFAFIGLLKPPFALSQTATSLSIVSFAFIGLLKPPMLFRAQGGTLRWSPPRRFFFAHRPSDHVNG